MHCVVNMVYFQWTLYHESGGTTGIKLANFPRAHCCQIDSIERQSCAWRKNQLILEQAPAELHWQCLQQGDIVHMLNGQTSITEIEKEFQKESLHFVINRADNPAPMLTQPAHCGSGNVTPPPPPPPPKLQAAEMQSTCRQSQVISGAPQQHSSTPSSCFASTKSYVTEQALSQGGYFRVRTSYDGHGEVESDGYLAVVEGDMVMIRPACLERVSSPPYRYAAYVYGEKTSNNSGGWLPVEVLGM